ncbi:hypothetical protein GW17_00019238 [Ensete ventricosum]|nr:hypothetical protein GW17_00019238 [Ensete ventricosum]
MKTSTTLPYRSKSGKRSSAVVPVIQKTDTSELYVYEKRRESVRKQRGDVLTEADVEDEKGVGVLDVRRSRSPEVRHGRRRQEGVGV